MYFDNTVKGNSHLLELSVGSTENRFGQNIKLEDKLKRYHTDRIILASTGNCYA